MAKRLLPRGVVVAVLVGLAFAVTAFADNIKKVNPAKHEVAKVLPKLKGMQLKEGLNEVETTSTGERIAANVKNGKVVGWVVTDSTGKKVPTTLRRVQAEGETHCWHCYKRKGNTHCFEIVCPF